MKTLFLKRYAVLFLAIPLLMLSFSSEPDCECECACDNAPCLEEMDKTILNIIPNFTSISTDECVPNNITIEDVMVDFGEDAIIVETQNMDPNQTGYTYNPKKFTVRGSITGNCDDEDKTAFRIPLKPGNTRAQTKIFNGGFVGVIEVMDVPLNTLLTITIDITKPCGDDPACDTCGVGETYTHHYEGFVFVTLTDDGPIGEFVNVTVAQQSVYCSLCD